MRSLRISVIALSMALVAAACGSDNGGAVSPTPTGDGSPAEVPVVEIGACVTEQGAKEPTEPRGEDFNKQLKEAGVLHVGSDNDFPPFESIPPGADKPEGFDVDLYTEVAKRLGLEAKSTTTSFDGLFTQSIPRGQFDVGVSAITIKESRKETVDFTVPYFAADLSLVVNTAKTPDIKTVDDLTSSHEIGVQQGTTGEDCAKVLVEDGKGSGPRSFDTSALMFDALQQGTITAVVNDRPASEGFLEQRPDLQVVQVIKTNERYGFAISQDKPDLRVAINEKLTEIMEDGTYATIYEKWFDTPPPYEVPLDE